MSTVIWEWSKENTQLKGRVPWGAPSTLTRALKKDGIDGLARVGMRLEEEGRIHLQSLYVFQKFLAYQKTVSEEEHVAAKGLGHVLLCAALGEFSKKWNLSPGTEIWLEASGGEVTEEEVVAHASNIPLRTILGSLAVHPKTLITLMYIPQKDKAVSLFLRRLPGDMLVEILARRVEEKRSPEFLHEVVQEALAIRQNRKLVAHYKQLGFVVKDDSDGLGVVMHASLRKLLETCRSASNPLLGHYINDDHSNIDRTRSHSSR